MQTQVHEGYLINGKFYTDAGYVHIPEQQKIHVTIIGESAQPAIIPPSLEWLKEFNRMLEDSADEELDIKDFPRMNFRRDPVLFVDECDEL